MDEEVFSGFEILSGNAVTVEGLGPGTIIQNAGGTGAKAMAAGTRLALRNLSIRSDFTGQLAQVGVDFAGRTLSLDDVVIVNQVGGEAIGIRVQSAEDSRIHLRNVTIDNTGSGTSTGAALAIVGSSGKTHRVEVTDSNFNYLSRGVVVQGAGNVQLAISNTTISHANSDGILVSSTGGTTKLAIKDSRIVNNVGNGLMLAPTGNAKVSTVVVNSALDGNVIGLRSFPANPATSTVSISDTSASNNAGGVHASGKSVVGIIRGNVSGNSSYGITAVSPATIRIGSSMVNGNTLGFSGPISSYGNNQLHGNTNPGSSTPLPPGSVP